MLIQRLLKTVVAPVLFGAVGTLVWACGDYASSPTDTHIVIRKLAANCRHASFDIASQASATKMLRSRGATALDELIEYRDARSRVIGSTDAMEIQNLNRVIDQVAGQKYASQSRLYWHTSIEDAQRESASTGRPILSLRMLGKLDEDLSCANSRFFRTTLYPDPTIATRLRSEFVLHWQSVHDVPIVTIDFGEGRKLKQPLTGNSAHIVLDADFRPIDVLPGLVSPQAFSQWIADVVVLWGRTQSTRESDRWTMIRQYHADRAARRRAESSLAVGVNQHVSSLNALDPRWTELAMGQGVRLASASLKLLENQRAKPDQPVAEGAMILAVTKSFAEVPVLKMVQPVESLVARDTVFNLYALQTKVDDWFASATDSLQDRPFTERIYADLFLMPLDDPWMGLSSERTLVALENGGRFVSAQPPRRPIANKAAKSQLKSKASR